MTTTKILFILGACAALAVLATAMFHYGAKKASDKPITPRVDCKALQKKEFKPTCGLDFLKDKKIQFAQFYKSYNGKYKIKLEIKYKDVDLSKEFEHVNPNMVINLARQWWDKNQKTIEEASKL